jgi:hypothetical protein
MTLRLRSGQADEMMDLGALAEKAADGVVLCDMISFAAETADRAEVGTLAGGVHNGKNPSRLVQRNGYRDRDWRHALPPSICASRGCAAAVASRASSSRDRWSGRL